MNVKFDLEGTRNHEPGRDAEAGRAVLEHARPARQVPRWATEVNWKIVRAVGLALLVWALIAAIALSL